MKKLYKGIVHTDCICEYARGDSPIRLELLEYEIQNISDDFISYNNGYELDTNCLEIERVSTSKKWLWSLNKQSVLSKSIDLLSSVSIACHISSLTLQVAIL